MRRIRFIATAVVGAAAVLAFPTGPAQAATDGCVQEKTVVTTLTDRSDGGYGTGTVPGEDAGVWATSEFTRTVVICEVTPPPGPSLVSSNYTATVHDSGTFVTLGGANLAPSGSGDLIAGVTGTIEGGFTATFSANAGFAGFDDSHLQGKTVSGDPASPQTLDNPSTGQWVKSLFTDAASFTGSSLDGDSWKWTYTTCTEEYVDAAAELGGVTGNITGTPTCPPTPPPAKPELATTGSDLTWLIFVGGGLVLVGGVVALFARRRRPTA